MPLPTHISEATRRLNPLLFGTTPQIQATVNKKRIRQQTGDGLNKLERDFESHLLLTHARDEVRPHGITLKLANGVRYTPDFFVCFPHPCAYEVKGRHAWDDAIVKLKVAASNNRWLKFYLCSRVDGIWRIDDVQP